MSNSPAVWILAWGQVENWSQGSAGIKSQQGDTTDVCFDVSMFPRNCLGPRTGCRFIRYKESERERRPVNTQPTSHPKPLRGKKQGGYLSLFLFKRLLPKGAIYIQLRLFKLNWTSPRLKLDGTKSQILPRNLWDVLRPRSQNEGIPFSLACELNSQPHTMAGLDCTESVLTDSYPRTSLLCLSPPADEEGRGAQHGYKPSTVTDLGMV